MCCHFPSASHEPQIDVEEEGGLRCCSCRNRCLNVVRTALIILFSLSRSAVRASRGWSGCPLAKGWGQCWEGSGLLGALHSPPPAALLHGTRAASAQRLLFASPSGTVLPLVQENVKTCAKIHSFSGHDLRSCLASQQCMEVAWCVPLPLSSGAEGVEEEVNDFSASLLWISLLLPAFVQQR